MSLTVIQKELSSWDNFNYLVYDPQTKKGIIIDASMGCEELLEEADEQGVEIESLLLTHTHMDHINGIDAILEEYPDLSIYVHQADAPDLGERRNIHKLNDGDTVTVGSQQLKILHTPGHKPGCICIYDEEVVFTGDTIFIKGKGRTDLPGGSDDELRASFEKLRKTLPDHLSLYPGHSYNGSVSTFGKEKNNF